MNTDFIPPQSDLNIRLARVQQLLKAAGGDAALISTDVNIYYLTGIVFAGYIYLPAEGEPLWFVRRPSDLKGERVISNRKPEDIPTALKKRNIPVPETLFWETDQITHNEFLRLEAALHPARTGNMTSLLRKARMIKTPWEIEQFRFSAAKHAEVYGLVPSLFRKGMTEIAFQIEIERVMRKNGSIGMFRTFGANMNIFMGSLLSGKNADTPSPFDFALGGRGIHPCLPIGASDDLIAEGSTVIIDFTGNFTAYMSDMSRVYSFGKLPEIAYRAHQVSVDMHCRLMEETKPGTACSDIYNRMFDIAGKSGFATNYMGFSQQAKFVGHGVGLDINEPPVLTERSNDLLQPGMVVAFEPKFVLPDIGAVGIENTYLVTDSGLEKLTVCEEGIIELAKNG
ncbi:MAG: Xaa-Pro peptidase family protein [Candidatus Azobacteroides sp.]|nr:Xaa-Pro peptidase family protein [Candidatus Azobacteroides sp.]